MEHNKMSIKFPRSGPTIMLGYAGGESKFCTMLMLFLCNFFSNAILSTRKLINIEKKFCQTILSKNCEIISIKSPCLSLWPLLEAAQKQVKLMTMWRYGDGGLNRYRGTDMWEITHKYRDNTQKYE